MKKFSWIIPLNIFGWWIESALKLFVKSINNIEILWSSQGKYTRGFEFLMATFGMIMELEGVEGF
jgi:hypothetical protein